ncbi:MAG: HEAT repeat domain-containing protein [Candidatus Zipacnadales bacterium]
MRIATLLMAPILMVVVCRGVDGQRIEELINTLRGENETARLAARRELACIGPQAVEPLLQLIVSPNARTERAARQTLLFLVFEWSNTPERREQVSMPLVEIASRQGDVTVRRFALELLGKVADERVTPLIADLLKDREVAFEAVQALQMIPHTDPTAALTVALGDAPPDLQVAILHTLAQRRDPRSASDIRLLLKSDNAEVRAAAADALGWIADLDTVPALTSSLTDADASVHAAAVNACLRLARNVKDRRLAAQLYKDVLRHGRTEAGLIGALVGISEVGDEDFVPMVEPFLKHDNRHVQVAAVTALGRLPGSAATTALTQALREASLYVVVAGLEALGKRGDEEALSAVKSLASDASREIRLKALWALGRLRTPAAIPELRSAITDGDAEIRAAALDAYLHLATDLWEAGHIDEVRSIYEDLAQLPERDHYWSAGVRGLGAVGSAQSLPLLAGLLSEVTSERRGEVFDAYFAICRAMVDGGEKEAAAEAYEKALTWVPVLADVQGHELDVAWAWRSVIADGLLAASAPDAAKQLYREALEQLPAGDAVEQVAQKLTAIGEQVDLGRWRGFITKWWVIGPFPNLDWGGWDAKYPPEERVDLATRVQFEGREFRWQQVTTDQYLSLIGPMGNIPDTDYKVAYAYAEFLVDEAQPTIIKVGSDDALRIWLNGQEVHANRVDRAATVDEDVVSANVQSGVNRLLCKVLNNAGGWGLIVRLCDARGRALRFTQEIGGGGEAKIPFEKIQLADGSNLLEACTVLDVNHDGKLDIASGGFWYESPLWTPHPYRDVTNDGNYANDWGEFAIDVNADGWTDIVSGGFHTEEISWYENPQGSDAPWPKHLAWSRGSEFYETMVMVDIDGDGQGDFLPNAGSPIRWFELIHRESTKPKFVCHEVGTEGAGHGIGYGDVNLDGRIDILCPTGWYEAPPDPRAGQWIWHPEWNIGSASVPILAHDVNGDHLADILWGGGHAYGLFWMEQKREGEARIWVQHTVDASFSQAHAPALADLDGDGDLDLIVGKRWKAHCGKDPGTDDPLYVYWFEFDRAIGEWKRWVISYNDGAGIGLQQSLVDIDNDGDLDLISACKTGLHLFKNGNRG